MKNYPLWFVLFSLTLVACRKESPEVVLEKKAAVRPSRAPEAKAAAPRSRENELEKATEAAVSKLAYPDLRIRWNEIARENLSQSEKALQRVAILHRVIESEGLEAGLALIADIPKGGNRVGLIEAAFEYSNKPLSELMAVRKSMKDADDREAAFYELQYAAGIRGRFKLSDLEGLDLKDGRDAEILSGVARFLVEDIRSRNGIGTKESEQGAEAEIRSTIGKIQEFLAKGNLTESQARGAVPALIPYPFTCWKLLQEQGEGSLLESQRARIVQRMASYMPTETIDLLLKSGSATKNDFEVVFDSWLGDDDQAPKDWFARNQALIPPDAAGQVISTFAEKELNLGDLAQAREWMDQIKDPVVKKQLEGQIWTKERDDLRKEVGENPAATVESIVAGQSKYGDYWLEEAMSVWVSKDFAKAQEWHEKHWKSMPQEKSQYVAAAFAVHALKEGDAATAEQWVGMIKDPKTKERIQAEITKAEARAK